MKKFIVFLSALAVLLSSCTKLDAPTDELTDTTEVTELTYNIDVMEGTKTVTSISLKGGMSFSSSAYFTPDVEYTVVLRSPIQQSTVYLYNRGTLLVSLNNQNHNEVKVLGKELNPFVISLSSFKVDVNGALIKE